MVREKATGDRRGDLPEGRRLLPRHCLSAVASNKMTQRGQRRLRQRSYARIRRRDLCSMRISPPYRTGRWPVPRSQPLPQLARCRRQVSLSLASGYEVAECELLQSSPLVSVTAPWLGPAQAEQVIRYFAGAEHLPGDRAPLSSAAGQRRLRAPPGVSPVWNAYLHRLADRFRAVFFSSRFDPLPPSPEVQAVLADWIRLCVRFGLQCWVQTRGVILPVLRDALTECRSSVRITLALSTLDDGLARALEPGAAPPQLRLRQLQWLVDLGIATQVTLAPLIPDLTDTRANLLPLLTALQEIGIVRATFGYLILDPLAVWEHPGLTPKNWAKPIAELYDAGQLRRWGPNHWARCLAWRERQRRYASLIAWGTELGFDLRPNTLADPDFRPGSYRAELAQPAFFWPN